MSAQHPRISPFLRVYGTGLVSSLDGVPDMARTASRLSTLTIPPSATADITQLQDLIPPHALRRIPHYARMGMAAAKQALQALPAHVKQSDLGLIIATAHAGQKMGLDFMDSIIDGGPRLSSPTAFTHAVNNMGAGLISLYFGIQGPCCTITQFSLSFAGALQAASIMLYCAHAPLVLLGCIDERDARFISTCAAHAGHVDEGAAFFLLGKADGTRPEVAVSWGASAPQDDVSPSPNDACEISSLALAINTLSALQTQSAARLAFTSSAYGRQAVIHVHV